MGEDSNAATAGDDKPHQCGLCERTISPGSMARRCVVTDLGKAHSFYYHEECDRATVVDRWDEMDWECHASGAEFIERLEELRADGKLGKQP